MTSQISFCDEFLNINNHPKAPRYDKIVYVGMLAPAALGAIKSAPYLRGSFVQYLPIPSNILSGLGVGVLHMTVCEEIYDKWIDSFFKDWGSWEDKSYANRTMRAALKLSAVALTLTLMSHCFSYCGTLKIRSYTIANFSAIPFEKALGYVLINKVIQAFVIAVKGAEMICAGRGDYLIAHETIMREYSKISASLSKMKKELTQGNELLRVIEAEAKLRGEEVPTEFASTFSERTTCCLDYNALLKESKPILEEIAATVHPNAVGLQDEAVVVKKAKEISRFTESWIENANKTAEKITANLEKLKKLGVSDKDSSLNDID